MGSLGRQDSSPPSSHARPPGSPSNFFRILPAHAVTFSPTARSLKSFSCNTYGFPRKCCKQKTCGRAKPFRYNTYKKQGGGGIMVNQLPLSSKVSTRLQPSFVLNRFHTLSFSVSCNSFACHSYENCRVCTNNFHSGSPRVQPRGTLRSMLARRSLGGLCANSASFFGLSTISCRLSTSQSPKSLPCHTSEPAGGGRQDTRGKCWPKAHPISRYNWRYGCAFDCFGHRRHTAG